MRRGAGGEARDAHKKAERDARTSRTAVCQEVMNSKIFRLLLAAGSLAALAACNKSADTPAAATSETTGQYIDDTAITTKVKASLAGDSAVKSSDIQVTTTQGVVVLAGQVDTSEQKTAAAKDAAGVAGVKDVTNNLTTK